jgi:D-alanyl-D-alanine carboxypeptidase/D-alanyl-D-alanine-endopeptidase (penicillin-binding protein 4)
LRWGVAVQTATSATTLYNRDGERYFIPASTLKLLTTAAALQTLGPNYRIRTSVYGDDSGSIYIVGRGDPSLTVVQLQDLAKQLKARGITQINRLIADDNYFRGSAVNPTWEWEDVQAGHGAPVNSLILNRNAMDLMYWPQNVGEPLRITWVNPEEGNGWQVENNSITVAPNEREFVEIGRDLFRPIVRVGGQLRAGAEPEPMYVAIVRPAENFLQRFREVLQAEGIRVLQSSISASPPASQLTELAAVDSPPLAELIKELNLESDNVYAEALLKTLGARAQNSDALEPGLKEMEMALTELGVDRE